MLFSRAEQILFFNFRHQIWSLYEQFHKKLQSMTKNNLNLIAEIYIFLDIKKYAVKIQHLVKNWILPHIFLDLTQKSGLAKCKACYFGFFSIYSSYSAKICLLQAASCYLCLWRAALLCSRSFICFWRIFSAPSSSVHFIILTA